jgi:MOSC domain-containing protein YiiM
MAALIRRVMPMGITIMNTGKVLYPQLNWTFGMFGENLTISGLDESQMLIGDIYKVGNAIIQVSQPRQPCNKFAAKFGDSKVIKRFIDFDHPGVYFSVIQSGLVQANDDLLLDLRNEKSTFRPANLSADLF